MGVISIGGRGRGGESQESRIADIFRDFGETAGEIRREDHSSERTYRRKLREIESELQSARRVLVELQRRKLVPSRDGVEDGRRVVTTDELEEATIRYTLMRKLAAEVGVLPDGL